MTQENCVCPDDLQSYLWSCNSRLVELDGQFHCGYCGLPVVSEDDPRVRLERHQREGAQGLT
jgi:hypothetical protein